MHYTAAAAVGPEVVTATLYVPLLLLFFFSAHGHYSSSSLHMAWAVGTRERETRERSGPSLEAGLPLEPRLEVGDAGGVGGGPGPEGLVLASVGLELARQPRDQLLVPVHVAEHLPSAARCRRPPPPPRGATGGNRGQGSPARG